MRHWNAQRANALGDEVHGQPELVVLLLEHQMQRVEHGSSDVPVEIVRLQIERVSIGQQPGQAIGDARTILAADANIDFSGVPARYEFFCGRIPTPADRLPCPLCFTYTGKRSRLKPLPLEAGSEPFRCEACIATFFCPLPA